MISKSLIHSSVSINSIKAFLIDTIALAFIYFLPALSHLTSIPFYMIEPMRLVVICCLLHTNSRNALLIAITIPLFSFFISSHPSIIKSTLIMVELLINLMMFYYLFRKINVFVSMFLSIVIAKIVYYSAKFAFIQMNMIDGNLVSTPLLIQWLVAIGLSLYAALIFANTKESNT